MDDTYLNIFQPGDILQIYYEKLQRERDHTFLMTTAKMTHYPKFQQSIFSVEIIHLSPYINLRYIFYSHM